VEKKGSIEIMLKGFSQSLRWTPIADAPAFTASL